MSIQTYSRTLGVGVNAGCKSVCSIVTERIFRSEEKADFTVTPDRWLAEVKVIDQVDRPGGTMTTLAKFVIDPRQPGPQSA